MDNKKWYNRFATIFWWTLTILPLIVALIQFIGFHFTFNSGMTSAQELSTYHSDSNGDFFTIFSYYLVNGDFTFYEIQLPFLSTMFSNLFNLLDIDVIGLSALSYLFGWMVSVQFYHLLFDFIIWLPQWFHRIMEKGMDKLS